MASKSALVPAHASTMPAPTTAPAAAVAIAIHTTCMISATPSTSHGPLLSKEVKLEELSKYFHLPEKAVAKELGICLTSLKKLCRSYGITRWPFRKLKSLERTMRKVQTETEAANNGENGDGEKSYRPSNEVKRKPYTVGNKTVFLSDEELEVFKMTMGKEQAKDLIPTPMSQLEPSLVHNATISAASSALASVARGPRNEAEDRSHSFTEGSNDATSSLNQARALSGCSPASLEGTEDCVIKSEVKGTSLEIVHWSTLWSQPQLKRKLLIPLNGSELRCSPDGTMATLVFASVDTAKRALRICNMAQSQAAMATEMSNNSCKNSKRDNNKALAAVDIITPAVAVPIDFASSALGVPSAPHTNMNTLLAESCGLQPPSNTASNGAFNLWATFLGPSTGPGSVLSALTGGGTPGVDGLYVKEESTRSGKVLGMLGDALPSPPMSSTSIGGMMDVGSATLNGPLSNIFPNMFQLHQSAGKGGAGSGVTPPHSTDSLGFGSYLQDENMGEASEQSPKSENTKIEQPKSMRESVPKVTEPATSKSRRASAGGEISPRGEKRKRSEFPVSPRREARDTNDSGAAASQKEGKEPKETPKEACKDAAKDANTVQEPPKSKSRTTSGAPASMQAGAGTDGRGGVGGGLGTRATRSSVRGHGREDDACKSPDKKTAVAVKKEC
eukprot:CAMPEP_0179432586 /NCGR_PEP_ID=MMETSP0799-20121207/17174_1 /TAXON_ID=46947 /ORGANISM="Geminigera cryophila, Strain CCMP2564" /LENGTH=673 /DNA_ID=CAMNT_0021210061 /DNA_START=179 /DNA_END=2200 /DNA_ORIENTATION=+